jgi:hypothetical protein
MLMQHHTKALIAGFGALLLLISAACGGAATTPASEPADDASGTGAIAVQEPWVRAAVMTGGSEMAEGEMAEGEMAEGEMAEGEMAEGEMADMGSGSNSAAYMVLMNESDTADTLIRASTDIAETVELHTVIMEDGVMMMRPVTQIDVPASGETELRPGGLHVMLLGITQDLEEGDTVDLTLTFENAGDVSISAPVRTGPAMDGGEMDGGEMDGGEMDGGEMDE